MRSLLKTVLEGPPRVTVTGFYTLRLHQELVSGWEMLSCKILPLSLPNTVQKQRLTGEGAGRRFSFHRTQMEGASFSCLVA
jgi:hypothetical protein